MRLAAIDIGSNAIHMVVADGTEQGLVRRSKHKEQVALGAGCYATGRLTDYALRAGRDAVQRLVSLALELGAGDIFAIATSATRDAANGRQFLRDIRRTTGIRAHLIDGAEEAALTFRAAAQLCPMGDRQTLMIDIGGGSVELALGDERGLYLTESLPLGEQRILDALRRTRRFDQEARWWVRAQVRRMAGPIVEAARRRGIDRVIGTSGTARSLAHTAAGRPARKLDRDRLGRLVDHLCAAAPEERSALAGVGERRAEAIPIGGLILATIMELAGKPALEVVDTSVLEGALFERAGELMVRSEACFAAPIPSSSA